MLSSPLPADAFHAAGGTTTSEGMIAQLYDFLPLEILDLVDLVILDIKAVDETEYQQITGHSQEKFNKFLESCISKNKKLWLRQVIVPNINDDIVHAKKLKEFASKIPNIERIELLPYHSMAKSKYEELKIHYRLENTPDMSKEECKKLEEILK